MPLDEQERHSIVLRQAPLRWAAIAPPYDVLTRGLADPPVRERCAVACAGTSHDDRAMAHNQPL